MKVFEEPIQKNQLKRGETYEIVYTTIINNAKNTLYRYLMFVKHINNTVSRFIGRPKLGELTHSTLDIDNIIRIRPFSKIAFANKMYVVNIYGFSPMTGVIDFPTLEGNTRLYTNNDLSILNNPSNNPNWRDTVTDIIQIHISQITDVLPISINDIVKYGTALTEPNKVGDVYTALLDENLESYFGGAKRSTKKKWSKKYKRSINCKKPKGFSQKQYCKYGRKTRGGTPLLNDLMNSVKSGNIAEAQNIFEKNPQLNTLQNCSEIFRIGSLAGYVDIAAWGLQLCRIFNPYYSSLAQTKNFINNLFSRVCELGHLEVAQWMSREFDNHVDTHDNQLLKTYYELGFVRAAQRRHLPVVEWLINMPVITTTTKIYTFNGACESNLLEVAQLIYNNIRPDITDTVLDNGFNRACLNRSLDVLLWLRELNPFRYEVVVNDANELISCRIISNKEEKLNKIMYSLGASNMLDKLDPESLEITGEYLG